MNACSNCTSQYGRADVLTGEKIVTLSGVTIAVVMPTVGCALEALRKQELGDDRLIPWKDRETSWCPMHGMLELLVGAEK